MCSGISSRLKLHGVDKNTILRAYNAAIINKTSFCSEILHTGKVPETILYRSIARYLDLDFVSHVDPNEIFIPNDDAAVICKRAWQVRGISANGNTVLYMAPREKDLLNLRSLLDQAPELRSQIVVTTPSVIREVLRERHKKELVRQAHAGTPRLFSASNVVEGRQAFMLALAIYACVSAIYSWTYMTLFFIHVILTLFFFGNVIIRLFAAVKGRRLQFDGIAPFSAAELPVYTVLVQLYRESEVVGQLVKSLDRLNWPASKLDIKLVCECDDRETIEEIRKRCLPAKFELVVVPSGGPRTKPKALNYALHFARGELVAVYDAEDRPHPDQLLEAWQAFKRGGRHLGCVQAPLIIGNFRQNMLTRMFAFEYSALFRGLLPWFARQGLVIPLGGTSNHFRRECLEVVGGWDAYNVTEDADLGLRLARYGYHVSVITRGTVEDAPEHYEIWHKQRTRWLKGWMQTWLVHNRRPLTACRELGLKRFLVNQIYTVGILASALVHPFMLVMLPVLIFILIFDGYQERYAGLLFLDAINILLAYLGYYLLGLQTMEPTETRDYSYFISIPVYWLLISRAAWRALIQLIHKPHLWEKTPHKPSAFYALSEAVRESVPSMVAPRPMID